MKRHIKIVSVLIIFSIIITSLPYNTFAATSKIVGIKDLSKSVYINQSYNLPKTVYATMSNKTTQKVAVTWNPKTVVTSKTGTFVFKGTIKGYTKKVLLTLQVIPLPTYSDPELARSVSLGIGEYSKKIQPLLLHSFSKC